MWPLGAPRDCRASQCSGPLLGTVTEAAASTIAKRRNSMETITYRQKLQKSLWCLRGNRN